MTPQMKSFPSYLAVVDYARMWRPVHYNKRARSTRLRVLMVAKVVVTLIRVPNLKFEREILNGVQDPLDNLLLAHKEVGKSNGFKQSKSSNFKPKRNKYNPLWGKWEISLRNV